MVIHDDDFQTDCRARRKGFMGDDTAVDSHNDLLTASSDERGCVG